MGPSPALTWLGRGPQTRQTFNTCLWINPHALLKKWLSIDRFSSREETRVARCPEISVFLNYVKLCEMRRQDWKKVKKENATKRNLAPMRSQADCRVCPTLHPNPSGSHLARLCSLLATKFTNDPPLTAQRYATTPLRPTASRRAPLRGIHYLV